MTDRENEPRTFVVDFDPDLFGPFKTRREAEAWAYEKVATRGERNRVYYVVRAVAGPAEPLEGAA